MIIVIDSDNLLSLYNSLDEVKMHVEAIDVEANEYELFDEIGQKYSSKIISPITAFKSGEFEI